ncbi:unnamed protein product [Scytosiphon promiscuus]
MVAIPVMKLFTMTIKTLAKPMSKRMKTEAQKHPRFRGVLNNMGQATHIISTRVSIRMAGHTTTKIKPLEEDKAIADGGDLLAEGFIYGLGAFLMVFEYMSSAQEKEEKEAKAKLKKENEKQELAQALEDLNQRLARLEALGMRRDDPPGRGKDGSSSAKDKKTLALSLSKISLWERRERSNAACSASGMRRNGAVASNEPNRAEVALPPPELFDVPAYRSVTGVGRVGGRTRSLKILHQSGIRKGEQQGFTTRSRSKSRSSSSNSRDNGDDADKA